MSNNGTVHKVLQLNYTDEYEISDLLERRLYLNSVVDESAVELLVYHILRYNRQDQGLKAQERKPIKLYINTPGGQLCEGFGLIDAIKASKTPVYTINQAMCASMGFLIYLVGKKRYTMQHSQFLMHDGSTAGFDSVGKLKDRMEFETQQIETEVRKHILEHTMITEELYEQKYRVEWYMLPKEAKLYNICTHIIGIDCDIDEII